MDSAFLLPAFLLGLILGSFYTACVHRWLAGETLWNPPRSRCPQCGSGIRWRDNIPVVSFILLQGKCRDCKSPIGLRYPAIELTSGFLSLLLAAAFGPSVEYIVYMVFFGILIVAAYIDFDSYLLPDILTLPGAVLALLCAPLFLGVPLLDAFLGAVIGAGFFWLLQIFYKHVKKTEGLGFGDVKLMLLLGALTGWKALPLIIFSGSCTALLAGVFYMLRPGGDGMKTAVPFGPFLSLGGILAVLLPEFSVRF